LVARSASKGRGMTPLLALRAAVVAVVLIYLAALQRGFVVADAEDFFQCSSSLDRFLRAVFQQGPHAEEAGLPADRLCRLAVKGHLANAAVELHQFEDALPAAIAAVVAISAAPAALEVGVGGAFRADAGGAQ